MSEDLELPSDLASIDPALAFVRSRAPTWVTDEVIDFGVTEAVTNAIVHGRGEAQARSVFALRVAEESDAFTVLVAWFGRPCPPEARRTELPEDVFAEHGRGLAILEALFDRVVWSDDGLSISLQLDRRA